MIMCDFCECNSSLLHEQEPLGMAGSSEWKCCTVLAVTNDITEASTYHITLVTTMGITFVSGQTGVISQFHGIL